MTAYYINSTAWILWLVSLVLGILEIVQGKSGSTWFWQMIAICAVSSIAYAVTYKASNR